MAKETTGLDQDLAIALGDRLRTLRNGLGLTQEALAEKAGMTRNHYQVIENGRTSHGAPANPTLKSVLNIATALDTSIVELLDGVFPKN